MNGVELAYQKGYRVDRSGVLTNKNGKVIKGHINNSGKGYLIFNVYTENKENRYSVPIHRLQAFIKFGKAIFEKGIVVRHINGISTDNSFENIEIGTQHENMMDIPEDKRLSHAILATKCWTKYKKDILDKIRTMKSEGYSNNAIQKILGISSKGTMSYIINNRI